MNDDRKRYDAVIEEAVRNHPAFKTLFDSLCRIRAENPRPERPTNQTFYPGDRRTMRECAQLCQAAAADGWEAIAVCWPDESWVVTFRKDGERSLSGHAMSKSDALMSACRAWERRNG